MSSSASSSRSGRLMYCDTKAALSHSSIITPPPDPPIDYTVRVPNGKPYRSMESAFRADVSNNNNHHKKPSISRRDSVTEVLNELDNVLIEESIPFEELRQRVEPFRDDVDIDNLPEVPYRKNIMQVPKLTSLRPSRLDDREEKIKQKIDEKYEKTLRNIEDAKSRYTPEHFKNRYNREGIPKWKQRLLAEKKAKEVMEQIEYQCWLDFERYKEKLKARENMKRSSSVQTTPRRTLNF